MNARIRRSNDLSRPSSKLGFGVYLDPPGNREGRYRFICYKVGAFYRVRMIFYSDKTHCWSDGQRIFDALMSNEPISVETIGKDGKMNKVTINNKERIKMPKYVIEGIGIWIPRYAEGKKDKVQEHTLSQEIALYKNHICPFFKGAKLVDVTVETVRDFEKHLQRKGLSAKTVSNCLTSLKRFFAYAEEQEWIRHTPFDSTYILPDAKPARRRQPYDIAELRATFMRQWKNPVFQAACILIRMTAMRASEDRAIKKSDFEKYYGMPECEDCVIVHINESLTSKNKRKAPKNERTRMTVIPRWAYEFIEPIFELSMTDLAFSNTGGRVPISLDKMLDNFRYEYSAANGTSADRMLKEGKDVHSIRTTLNSLLTGHLNDGIRRAIFGWSSSDVGMDHYFQLLPVHYQQVLDALKTTFTDEEIEWYKSHSILG